MLSVLILLIIGCVYFFSKNNRIVKLQPEPPINISKHAIWIGGVDGGNWYKIDKALSTNTYQIKNLQ